MAVAPWCANNNFNAERVGDRNPKKAPVEKLPAGFFSW
jgi:hypothetical protein